MKSNHSSPSILVLGGYGTVGSVVVDDLLESGYSVTVAGRNSRSIDQLLESKNHPLLTGKVVDVQDCSSLRNACSGHDIVLSCLDYSLNATVISTCADLGIHYVDLGDNYDGILHSHTYNAIFSNNKKLACLGAGSAPGIINVLVAYLARDKEQVHNLTISFADVLYKKPENMLPFNFMTVTEEILDPALVFRDGEHRFIPGMSESQSINFGDTFGTHTVYATNHDETYSLPKFL